mgnify:FL=1
MNKNKNFFRPLLAGLFGLLAGVSMTSCSSDDDYPAVDDQAPVLQLTTAHIQTEPGRQFTIEGIAKDADGLKSITLKNEGMNLDKTIDFLTYYPDTLLTDYHLSYHYTAGSEWKDADQYPVTVTVEDVRGHQTEQTVLVTPDGDFTAPTFTQTPSKELTVLLQNPNLSLTTAVADNKNLSYLVVSIPDLNVYDSLSISGTSYILYNKVYEMPEKEATYNMTVTVGDKFNNRTSTASTITVSDLPDFDKMYLADVDDAADLTNDVYGVPMLIDHTGKYQYRALYYNKTAGTGVRFIPRPTSSRSASVWILRQDC